VPETTANIADLAQHQPARLRALEARHAQNAARPLAQAIADVQQDATRRWLHATSSTQRIPVLDELKKLIDHIRKALTAAFEGRGVQAMREAQRAAYTAASLGIEHASRIVALFRGVPPPPVDPERGPAAEHAAAAIPAAVQAEQSHALALLTTTALTAGGAAGLASVFSRARKAVTRITAGVAVAVTSAAAHAASTVARLFGKGMRLLWVAEPGACPACAAYAGRSVAPGRLFPGGLSLDPARTVFMTPLAAPPRHPFCRCCLIPWHPSWHALGTPLPQLLQQRARRAARVPAPARRS
jgi:hypothetical protein